MSKKDWIKFSVMCSIIVAFLTLDLVTKYVFEDTITETISIIPYLFNFTEVIYNTGAAWGMLAGRQLFLIALSLFFLAIFIYYYVKERNRTWLMNITFAFLFAGCLGNLYDRIVIGSVRDFIQFDFWRNFPVFNFADIFLCLGMVLFVIYMIIYFVRYNKKIKIEKPKDDKNDKKD